MAFDICQHKITQVVLKAGAIIRALKGLPEEEDITILYRETAPLLGIIPEQTVSGQHGNHLPTPADSLRERGITRKCPQCGRETYQIFGLCASCQESEGGRFKTLFECSECHFKEKSDKHMVVWLEEMGVDFGNQTKQSLGIKTITDEGVK